MTVHETSVRGCSVAMTKLSPRTSRSTIAWPNCPIGVSW
jgi:hypothetical protein